ncbi:MAG: hypothetical protein V1729_04305 [Candidatus Woesearchaeota archaeon]
MDTKALQNLVQANKKLVRDKKNYLLHPGRKKPLNNAVILVIAVIIVIAIVAFPFGDAFAKGTKGIENEISDFDYVKKSEGLTADIAAVLAHAASVGKNKLPKVIEDFNYAKKSEGLTDDIAVILAHASANRGNKAGAGAVIF